MSQKKTNKELAELEKDKSFIRSQIPFSLKWKSWLYVGPVLLLFMSIFSVLYLLEEGKLATWYVVPYIVVFVVATIWFKAVRKHLLTKFLNAPGSIITAFAKPVLVDKYKVYALFSTGTNRHNASFIEHQASLVSSAYADLIPQLKPGQAVQLFTDNDNSSDCLYLSCHRNFTVRKNNIGWDEKDLFALLLINKKKAKSI
jgi:hypothetical protein